VRLFPASARLGASTIVLGSRRPYASSGLNVNVFSSPREGEYEPAKERPTADDEIEGVASLARIELHAVLQHASVVDRDQCARRNLQVGAPTVRSRAP